MEVYALGIDPGKTGAIAVFRQEDKEFYLQSIWDYEERQFFVPLLRQLVASGTIISTCVELVHSAPGQGVASVFSFGANFGWWLGILDAYFISYTLVSPQKWQGTLFKGHKDYTGRLKQTTKEVSLEVAKSLFNRDKDSTGWFERKKDHGRSDAALIGWYGITRQV